MKTSMSHFKLTGILAAAVFASSSFNILPSLLPNQPSAFATFPGENGKIAFTRHEGNSYIYLMNADGTGLTRLTNNPAPDQMSGWSPDGTKIAFTSNSPGDWEVYIMNADGREVKRFTGDLGNTDPSWSPDGTKIVYTSFTKNVRTYQIFVMNGDGSSPIRLTNRPTLDSGPDWGTVAKQPEPPVRDTTLPVLTVSEDIVADAITANGGTVVTTQ